MLMTVTMMMIVDMKYLSFSEGLDRFTCLIFICALTEKKFHADFLFIFDEDLLLISFFDNILILIFGKYSIINHTSKQNK